MYYSLTLTLIVFAFNAKSFAIAILIFFPSCHSFWKDCQKLNNKPLNFRYQENVWPRSYSLLGHTKTYFLKDCSLSCYLRACGLWYGLWTVTSIHIIQKTQETTRTDRQKLGNKLGINKCNEPKWPCRFYAEWRQPINLFYFLYGKQKTVTTFCQRLFFISVTSSYFSFPFQLL